MIECTAPASSHQDTDIQEVAIPVEIPSQFDPQNDQGVTIPSTQRNAEPAKIPQLEENTDREQYQDLDTYLSYHNTFEASQRIHREYRSRLLTLDNDKYYQEVNRAYSTYGTPAAQDYRPANQAPGPCQTTQELMQICGKGGGQACREELHGHRPFSTRMRSLQSHIQRKIRKTQQMRHRYANAQ